MKNESIRVGTEHFANKSTLDKSLAYDLIFGSFYEFVYLPDYTPLQYVNNTWTGALGHLLNDYHMD